MKSDKKNEITIHSSTAEYLTFIAATGDNPSSVEMRYQDENIWLTQKMMAELYGVEVHTINEHIKKIYTDGELIEIATIRNFRIVQTESELDSLATVKEYLTVQNEGKIDKKSNVQNLHIPNSRLLRTRRKNWKAKLKAERKGAMKYEI